VRQDRVALPWHGRDEHPYLLRDLPGGAGKKEGVCYVAIAVLLGKESLSLLMTCMKARVGCIGRVFAGNYDAGDRTGSVG
jgi:hypothetical protein